jgi:hypothetical protein
VSNSFVTVARFGTAAEAHILKGRLEAEGVAVTIADEETVSMAWHLGQAVGGIKVQVNPQDAERAREITAAESSLGDITAPRIHTAIAEGVARRAMRAAFFGILIPPLQLYSIWLVVRLLFSRHHQSPTVNRRIVLSLVLDLWVVVLAAAMVGMLTR